MIFCSFCTIFVTSAWSSTITSAIIRLQIRIIEDHRQRFAFALNSTRTQQLVGLGMHIQRTAGSD